MDTYTISSTSSQSSHVPIPPPRTHLNSSSGSGSGSGSGNNSPSLSMSPAADEFKKKLQLQLQNGSPNNNFQYKKNINNNTVVSTLTTSNNGNSNGNSNSYSSSPLQTSNGISYTITTASPPVSPLISSTSSLSSSLSSYDSGGNNLNSSFEQLTNSSAIPPPPSKQPPPIPNKKSKSDRLSVKILKNNSKSSFSKEELPPLPTQHSSPSLHNHQTNNNTNNNNSVSLPTTPSSSQSSPSTSPSSSPQLPAHLSKYNKIPLPQIPQLVQSASSPSISQTSLSSLPLPPIRPPPPSLNQETTMYNSNNNNNHNNNESNSTTTSEGGLTPESYESKLQEIVSQQPPSTPRLAHESKVIPSEIEITIIFHPSTSISSGNLTLIEKNLIFSPCSTIDEALSIIIPNFQHHHGLKNVKNTTNNEWETEAIGADFNDHQSFALFSKNNPTIPLHKEKTILELQIRDLDTLILKTVSLAFTFVRVIIPQFTEGLLPAFATVKFNQFTSIRSIIRKLFLKFHTNVDISKHGIFLGGDNQPLDEDELFSTYKITSSSNLSFRTLSNTESDLHLSQKILNLKIIISTNFTRNNTLNLMFDPKDYVSKAIKQTGLRTGLLDSLNKCGFYLTPSEDDDEGFWMDEDLLLENYNLKNNTFLSFKERCKRYTVIIKPTERKCTFKFDQFTKVSTLFNILVNNESIKNPKDYHLSIKNGQTLEKHRYIWSYDIKNDIEFKEYPNKLLIFNPQNGEKNFVYVDFNDPIKDVCSRLSQSFTSPVDLNSMLSSSITSQVNSSGNGSVFNGMVGSGGVGANGVRERSFTFKRLGTLVNTIDNKKSLKDQGVNPNDALMLEVIDEQPSSTDVKSVESTPPTTPIIDDLIKDGTILSEEKQLNIWEEPMDSNENIIYSTVVTNNLNEIDAATLNKLIVRLTNPDFHDLTFMKTFLMTYSSYTTTATLLKKLFERFQVPTHIDERERLSAQLRVANVIKYWVEHHYEDFCHESTKLMVDFVDTNMMIAFPTLGNQIRNCILKRTCGFKYELTRTRSNGALTSPRSSNSIGGSVASTNSNLLSSSSSTPLSSSINNNGGSSISINSSTPSSPSLMPSSPRPISSSSSHSSVSLLKSPPKKIPETKTKGFLNPRNLFDFDDEEIARQLTLYDFQLYTAIKPTEFLNQAWNKPSMAARKSPTILKIISRFNDISLWVVSLILEPDRVKTRAKRLKRIISIADELRKLNNYNTCIAFISGINNSAILRLKFTRGLISKKYTDILESLEKDMSCEGSYKSYRDKLKNLDPPVVPIISVYLTDLTFIEEGNPNIIRGNLINFAKYYLVYRVISEIQQYQWTEYLLNVAPIIQTFIKDIPQQNADELYHLSLLKEPRNSFRSDIL